MSQGMCTCILILTLVWKYNVHGETSQGTAFGLNTVARSGLHLNNADTEWIQTSKITITYYEITRNTK